MGAKLSFAVMRKTLAAELTPEGIWRGRWVVYEKNAHGAFAARAGRKRSHSFKWTQPSAETQPNL